MDANDTISLLNGLIETSINGERGYAEAATLVTDTQIETILQGYAKERAGFARALKAEVEKLGGTPAESGTVGATVHRGWMELKSAVTGGSSNAILSACETGEDQAWTEYKRVVDSPISGVSRTLVEAQWKKVNEALAHLQHLQGKTPEQKPD